MTTEQLNNLFTNEQEPITEQYKELIENTMNVNGWSWQDVLEQHTNHPNKRIWRIISGKKH